MKRLPLLTIIGLLMLSASLAGAAQQIDLRPGDEAYSLQLI